VKLLRLTRMLRHCAPPPSPMQAYKPDELDAGATRRALLEHLSGEQRDLCTRQATALVLSGGCRSSQLYTQSFATSQLQSTSTCSHC
jgi:hypothetical protein